MTTPDNPENAGFDSVNNPHDSFFREMMREPRVYRESMRRCLPADVRRHLDLRTVKPTTDHFVDERLRHLYADCVYRARTRKGAEALVYVLVEHKSTPEYWSTFYVWRYVFAAWDDYVRSLEGRQGKLPLIIPILVYNGARSFNADLDLRALVQGEPELVSRILFGPVHLINLSEIGDDELRREVHLGVMLLTLKHAYDAAMPFETIIVHLATIEDPHLRRRFLFAALRYIFSIRRDAEPEVLEELIAQKLGWQGAEIVTIAERWEKQGYQKGVLAVALELLKNGLEEGVIQKCTGLSHREIQALKNEHSLA